MLIHEGLLLRSPGSLEPMQASHIHCSLVHDDSCMDKTEWRLFILDVVSYSLNLQFRIHYYSRLFIVLNSVQRSRVYDMPVAFS